MKRNRIFLGVILLLVIALAACSKPNSKEEVRKSEKETFLRRRVAWFG